MMEQQGNSKQPVQKRRESALSPQVSDNPTQDLDLKELIQYYGNLITARDADYEKSREYLILNKQEGVSGSQYEFNQTLPVSTSGGDQPLKKEVKEIMQLVIGDKIGHGGFGNVYKAQLVTQRAEQEVGVKQAKYTGLDALINENEIFSHLKDRGHDHIIERKFLCQADDLCILGLEFVQGMNLSEIVFLCKHRKASFPHKDLVFILVQQNSALKFLRDNGIMHCDIKPENIIYNRETKKTKLIDFGLAMYKHGLNEHLVKRHGGTTEFMAIETLIDHELHVKSDMYGLGSTLYNLAMLETPWHFLPTIQDISEPKLEREDPNYQAKKEARRKEIKIALEQEISEYREMRQQHMASPNHAQPSEQRYVATSLQCNLWTHRARTNLHDMIIDIVCRMLSHDSSARPSCDDIEVFMDTNVFVESHVMRQVSSAVSLSSSGSGSDSSDINETDSSRVAEDDVMYTGGDLPATIHHSSTMSSQMGHLQDWEQPEILPNTIADSISRMSIDDSYTCSTDYMASEPTSSSRSHYTSQQPEQTGRPELPEGEDITADDNNFLPLTLSFGSVASAGPSSFDHPTRPSQPTQDDSTSSVNHSSVTTNADLVPAGVKPIESSYDQGEENLDTRESCVVQHDSQQVQDDLNMTQEDSRQVYDDLSQSHGGLQKTVSNPLTPQNTLVTAQDDDDDDDL